MISVGFVDVEGAKVLMFAHNGPTAAPWWTRGHVGVGRLRMVIYLVGLGRCRTARGFLRVAARQSEVRRGRVRRG